MRSPSVHRRETYRTNATWWAIASFTSAAFRSAPAGKRVLLVVKREENYRFVATEKK